MVAQFVSFFLALAILRETSMEVDVNENSQCHFEKKANKQTSQQQFSMVCTLLPQK